MGRILFSGTNSGCGKTTVTCAVLQALKNRGIEVTSFKCGPDYLDPMFQQAIIGVKSYNIDSFMMSENTIKSLVEEHESEISVIDGIKGYYDGVHFTRQASTYEISLYTKTPSILVIDCSGMEASAGAVIYGFLKYHNNTIKGVIFNRLNSAIYDDMKKICSMLKLKCLGYLPKMSSVVNENKHLTLINQTEIDDMKIRMKQFAEQAEKTIDIDEIINMAKTAMPLKSKPISVPVIGKAKIALSLDKVFCFHYRDNIEILEKMGADIVTFSPLNDKSLPDNINGIILSGGYPEMHGSELSKNVSMLESIRNAIGNGVPTIAESGGFIYLHDKMYDITGARYRMVGVIDGSCYRSDPVTNYGYIELTSDTDNLLLEKGDIIKTYEFHYYESTVPGDTFTARKLNEEWKCINSSNSLYAGFPHLHFYSNIKMAERFMKACVNNAKNRI